MKPFFPIALLALTLGTATISQAAPAQKSKTVSVAKSLARAAAPVAHRVTSTALGSAHSLSVRAREVVMYSLALLQTGYVWGGKTPEDGLDCSGLVTHVMKEAADIPLEGNSATLATKGKRVSRSQLRVGDLVFFNTMNRKYSHVGIYLGDNNFVHSPNSNSSVRVESLTTTYWAQRFEMARTLDI